MCNFIGAVVIIVCSCIYGFKIRLNLRNRVNSLNTLRNMLEELRAEISFKKTRLGKAVHKIGYRYKNDFFIKWAESISEIGGQAALAKALKEVSTVYGFSDEDINVISGLGNGLGRCDIESQLRQIDYTVSQITKNIIKSENDLINKGRICLGGSFLVGLFLVLILI